MSAVSTYVERCQFTVFRVHFLCMLAAVAGQGGSNQTLWDSHKSKHFWCRASDPWSYPLQIVTLHILWP